MHEWKNENRGLKIFQYPLWTEQEKAHQVFVQTQSAPMNGLS